jgi:hypothetical protein
MCAVCLHPEKARTQVVQHSSALFVVFVIFVVLCGEAPKPQRRPSTWQVSKSTNSLIYQHPLKNGNSGNGGC